MQSVTGCAVSSVGCVASEDKSVCAASIVGGAVNSVYDYLNLVTRSPQVCTNKSERVNKFQVSECSKSFTANIDRGQDLSSIYAANSNEENGADDIIHK